MLNWKNKQDGVDDVLAEDINNIANELIASQISMDQLRLSKQDKLTAGDGITIDENNVISASGGGSGGTTDYELLENKPQINGVELVGNKSLSELGIEIPAKDKKYELIETITLTEDVQQITRTSEPDGRVYNFKKLAIDYKSTQSTSRVRLQGNYKFGNSTFPYNCYIVANHEMGYIEVDASDILKYYGAGGAATGYTTPWCTTGAFAQISKADSITSLIIEGTKSLYAGTVINIYGVR